LFSIHFDRGLRQVNLSRGTDAAYVTIALALCLKRNKGKRIAAGPKSGTEEHRRPTHKKIS